ncbi:hypothetical protein A9Q81_03480 [Gammaproteobacteria bacterium 42_54_T18]|nr:hypothetical protein A9Q81_03480 [Gammaproteobacteria bacterium 42_54_T18]
MTAVAEFLKNPIAFLEANRLQVKFSNDNAGVYDMSIESEGDNSYALVSGRGLRAYWCPYNADQVHAVTLGSDADFMFTATMNGCSFGIGSPSPDGAVRVAHANTTEHEAIAKVDKGYAKLNINSPNFSKSAAAIGFRHSAMKQQLQLTQLKSLLAKGGKTMSNHLSSAAYGACDNITTFGIRDSGVWKFYFQGRIKSDIVGVFPFPKVNS